ncbi:MAG: Co2+/Mg2+ efflux protein ApaG [Burkholderiaceae bacterium]|jgi:ApaG protein|nr:Co2+/Mg2+ efflux protein ApaG [Burkholderiaceae bacterium]MCO5103315.1 Co2+/Mg2+ efflux protein ApaG [Burkholderiaceae bacterium]MCO5109244.1 Co2+/Mg2+ efflux protein ApaG [Burkholderiaceae bacterium]
MQSSAFDIQVQSAYLEDQSAPEREVFTFSYTITIANRGDAPAQLIARHWHIEDERGPQDEVRGLGVVGQQPLLRPGERFEYTSGCRLRSDTGSMQGSYRFVTEAGEFFDVAIPRFVLHAAQDGGQRVLH